jgi:glycosyltransferase involved in cell wall biosynthesis
MKIAVFHNVPSGGAKRALHEAVRRLSPRHRIDVFTLSTADHEFADIRPWVANHNVTQFSPLPLFSSPFGRINNLTRILDLVRLKRVCGSIARLVDSAGYDLLFAQPCRFENSSSVLRHVRRTPAAFYCQEPLRVLYETPPPRPYMGQHAARRQLLDRLDPFPGLYRSVLKRRDRANLRSAGAVLVNSNFIRESVNSIYGRDAQVSYLGVDTEKFRPLRRNREPILLSVGSLTPLKGFDFLIRSVACLPAHRRPLLQIASNFEHPPERFFLEQLARELHVDLRLLSNITEEALVECYNAASLVIYAPIREPFGLVALEAMACGVPVVAVREGGIPETVIHEQTGLLVNRHEDEFAEAIACLLDQPALASRLGINGREHVTSRWTWNHAVANLEQSLLACSGKCKEVPEARRHVHETA